MTKFNTVKREANVGERILITNVEMGSIKVGDIGVVTELTTISVRAEIRGMSRLVWHEEYEVIIENKTEAIRMEKTTVITEDYHEKLAFTKNTDGTFSLNFAQMPALVHVSYDGVGSFDQTFIHGDYKAEAQRVTIESAVGKLTKYTIDSMAAIKPVTATLHKGEKVVPSGKLAVRTPQEIRDDTIEQAKRDVADLLTSNGNGVNFSVGDPCLRYRTYYCDVEYVVNSEKRTIVALMKGVASGRLRAKGIAKCAPTDCFNAHIGKAIALRRALGLEVPAEYLNAPPPTEVRVGDVIQWDCITGSIYTVKEGKRTAFSLESHRNGDIYHGYTSKNIKATIIDDSRDGVIE